MRSGCVVLLLAAIFGSRELSPTAQNNTCSFAIAAFREFGTVNTPPSVTTRDGGSTALIGNKILWTFGDTLFTPQSEDRTNLRSNTAALADPSTPLVVTEPVDAKGAP